LTVEFSAFQQPHEKDEIREFDRRFKQLRRFQRNSERCSGNRIRQRIVERYGPPMMRRFTVATSGCEAANASDGVSQGQTGSERVAGAEWRHVVLAHVPSRGDEGGEQASGEDSSGLQRRDAENLARMSRVIAPLIDDVEDFRAENSAENNQDPEIPSLVAVIAEPFGVADTDPKPEQDSQRDKESVGRQEEASDVKKLWEH